MLGQSLKGDIQARFISQLRYLRAVSMLPHSSESIETDVNVVRQAVTATIKAVTAGSLKADVVPLVDVVRQGKILSLFRHL